MTKRKILVVDDEEAVRHWVAEFLRSEGYDVLEADGAEAAIAAMPGHRLDGFLLDIDMPGASGTALCRRIRGIQEYETAPIMFVTGSTANQEEAFAAGCDDLIDKPFDPLVLRARLHGHLARAETARMLDGTRRMLDRYVSRRTREVAELEARTGTLSRPERRDVVILFTDIRGFTALSEDIEPGELFSLVSAQLEAQVRLVHEYGGYVDKFGGDGIMAIFEGGGKAAQSCRCALHIMESARRTAVGDQRIRQLGIGIHSGPVVIGNIGSSEHLDYSAIGNAVNLAARLCGQATAMSIVVSKAIRDAAMDDSRLRFDAERQAAIRGLKDPVTVYTLGAADDDSSM